MVSCCMIVRQGEDTLRNALESVRYFVDEIVVGIDDRTTDHTEEIAKEFGAKVFWFTWVHDFSYARNLVAHYANYDHVLVVDVDDRIVSDNFNVFRELEQDGTDAAAVRVDTAPGSFSSSTRFYNRKKMAYRARVHEHLFNMTDDDVETKQIENVVFIHRHSPVILEPERNLDILKNMIQEVPRTLYYHATELFNHHKYKEAIVAYQKYMRVAEWDAELYDAKMNLALSYGFENDYVNARKQCFDVILSEPNYQPAYNLLGQIAMLHKQYKEAAAWFEHSLTCDRTFYMFDNTASTEFNSKVNLAICYAHLGDKEKCMGYIQRAKENCLDQEWLNENIELIKHLL